MLPRTGESTREASVPPDESLISGTVWMAGVGRDETHQCLDRLPLRVKSVGLAVGQPLPVHPDQRTFAGYVGTLKRARSGRRQRFGGLVDRSVITPVV
jgi:hypothetical protein